MWNASPGGIVPLLELKLASTTVPNSILDDPKHWQERAEEARSIADHLKDPESGRMMLRIADDYDRLATHARARVKARAAQSSA